MRAATRHAAPIAVTLMLVACGSPATPTPPKAAAPAPAPAVPATAAKPATPPVLDPKGTIDAAKTAAASANAAVAERQPTDAKTGAAVPPAPGMVAAATAAPALTPTTPKYDAAGRRDPFESLEARLGSQRSTVANAKLTGVIHSAGIAFALVETADGIGYILKPGDTLADGRLLEIGPAVAVFAVAPKPGTTNNRVVLTLAGD